MFDWSEKYESLIDDSDFLKKFEKFMKLLISDLKNPDKKIIKVDETIYNFIENYIIEKRKNKINKILRKKDI